MSSIVDMSRCISPPPKKKIVRDFHHMEKDFGDLPINIYLWIMLYAVVLLLISFCLKYFEFYFFFILFQTDIGFLSRSFCLNANLRKELSFTSILPIYRNVVKEEWYYVIWLSEIWKQYTIYYVDQIVFKT